MKTNNIFLKGIIVSFFLLLGVFFFPSKISAHCDTLDGPVVNAARKAMNTGNVNYVLIWVKPEVEDEIRKALKKARAKIKAAKTKEEKEKAEYEGVKPAGTIEPEIALCDKAVDSGMVDEVLHHIKSTENKEIVLHLFHKVKEKSHYDVDDVLSGREYIDAYVNFIHAAEKAIMGVDLKGHHLHHH